MRILRVLAALVLALALVVTGNRSSDAASTFSASAGGELARVVVNLAPPLLQADLLDPGAVTAQASLTSFGESIAFAATPYPGSLAVSMPGTLDGLIAMSSPELAAVLNLPEYPLIASSSYPATPSSNVEAGSLSMRADSRERESVGVASDGANRTEARIVADPASDIVTASATSEVGAVDLGPSARLSGVRSEAKVVQAPGGELERSTKFSVASLVVLGQQLRLGSDGFELVGVNVPVGLNSALDPVEELLAALTQQTGISIRFIEPTETPEGVISAGLEIQRAVDTGVNGIVATVTTTLGRTFANTSNSARPAFGDLGLLPASPLTSQAPSSGSGSTLGVDAGSTNAAAPAEPEARSTENPLAADPEPITALVPDTTDAGRFYPVILLGSIVLVVGFSLFRKIGVRTAWTS